MEETTQSGTSEIERRLIAVLAPFVGTIIARSILGCVRDSTGQELTSLHESDRGLFRDELQRGLKIFLKDPDRFEDCVSRLDEELFQTPVSIAADRVQGDLCIKLVAEEDICKARDEARRLCEEIGFPLVLQVKVVTVASELARNIIQFAGSGQVRLEKVDAPRKGIEIVASDAGPGINDLDAILSGERKSRTGLGMGLVGARNLMDEFDVVTGTDGTTVTARKYLSQTNANGSG